MNSDGGSDMAANAWPGFVDILSAVVIMFVFFVLITAAVLYFYTITYKARMEGQAVPILEEAMPVTPTTVSTKLEALVQENKELRMQIKAARSQADESGVADTDESSDVPNTAQTFGEQVSEQAVHTAENGQSLLIFHDSGAVTVDEENAQKIEEFLKQMALEHGAENIEVVLNSPKSEDAITQTRAKRLPVARMLNVRNSLLGGAVDRKNIKVGVVDNEKIEGSDNWTRISIRIRK